MAKTKARKAKLPQEQADGFTRRFVDLRIQSVVLIVIGLAFYANSFANSYALDDGIVIHRNSYVQQGLAGLPRIFSTDVYQSFYAQMGADQQLAGGRYRPLSLVTFALEQQLFGSKETVKPEGDIAFLRHFINVGLYILSVVLLLRLLRQHILPTSPYAAFLTCLLFLIHPLHTEVVANVKSRDEILSFLFIVLTLQAVFEYGKRRKPAQMVFGLLFYFLALLSKEYALTLIALIPLLMFVVNKETLAKSITAVLPFVAVAIVYLTLRFSIVGLGNTAVNEEVLNNPYKFATDVERWATKIAVLARYLGLLVFPYPLSYDYSYKAIPYTNFGDFKVWWSILLHLGMIAATIILFIRRNILAFAFAFYLTNLLLVSNFFVEIGATMGERLVYHSSFGFALAVAILFGWALQKIGNEKQKTVLTIVLSLLLTIPCGAVVIPRNSQWKNDTTLYLADAEKLPESALLNGNAGKAYLDLSERPENRAEAVELVRKSIPFSQKAVEIHNRHLNGYLNLGVAYAKLGELEKAEAFWNVAEEIYPDHPYVSVNRHWLGQTYRSKAMAMSPQNTADAIQLLEKAVKLDSENPEVWRSLGEVRLRMNDVAKARAALTTALRLKPNYKEVQQELAALPAQ